MHQHDALLVRSTLLHRTKTVQLDDYFTENDPCQSLSDIHDTLIKLAFQELAQILL
ncbi:MAG: hypothetical protein ACK4L8_01170 [Nitrincola lacisaponensis]|uniref:hypothetical protein n=1 Tax=Nitrincola lacisaponensis TaxID=267850 RepID=UPI00391D4FC8